MKTLFTIGMLSEITGVAQATLRSWERRYGIPAPRRSETNRRQYDAEQVAIVNRLKGRLDKGERIGKAVEQVRKEPVTLSKIELFDEHQSIWMALREQMLGGVERFDEAALNDIYNKALALFPVNTVTDSLLCPVLRTLGVRWADHPGGVAEEHFFTGFLRAKIGALAHYQRAHVLTGPRLLAACLPDEGHEIGLLLFCLEANAQHFRTVCLGARTPLDQVECLATDPDLQFDAIVLSASLDPDPLMLRQDLPLLANRLAIPVFVGGLASLKHEEAFGEAGVMVLGNDIESAMSVIQQALRGKRFARHWGV